MKFFRRALVVVAALAVLFAAFVLWRIGPKNVIGIIRYDRSKEGSLKPGDTAPDAALVPLVVDGIENPANSLYAGWPERFCIVDERGVIVYKGKPGPFGYHPEEVEAWLAERYREGS